ncbi:MAG: ATPase, T2SS/T4P/T4SS family [Thermodesulfobacteriota bacterium]
MGKKKKIGELLLESGLINAEQLESAIDESGKQKGGGRLGELIVKLGYASGIDIAQALAYQLGVPFIALSNATVDPEAVRLIGEDLAKKHLLIPLYTDGKELVVAMADPLNLHAIDDLRFVTGYTIKPSIAASSDIIETIGTHYDTEEIREEEPQIDDDHIDELMGDIGRGAPLELVTEGDSGRDIHELVKKSSAPPIIKIVDSIIFKAMKGKASDIHIEPQEKSVVVRLRVDGLMREEMVLPRWVSGPVSSRVKIMSKLDIAERRVPQDGRISVKLGKKKIDLRVSTLPTQYGETVVMRILDSSAALLSLDDMGLSKRDEERVKGMIERPQGVVIVTGPTGSGKTSTLYAVLQRIKEDTINIITIEDPIEFELPGVSQVATSERAGRTFAAALRAVLRQDPDVVLVGEMRDTETAVIGHQAAMTGHMVLSTLHTNDAVSTVTRLRNMDVPKYMIAGALNGIVAQRLLRRICSECKEEYVPTAEELERLGCDGKSGVKLFRGKGCGNCNGTGYKGRIGAYEVMTFNEKLRDMIIEEAGEQDLRREAMAEGMTLIHEDGIDKVLQGITTPEELMRVIYIAPKKSKKEHPKCPACFKDADPEWVACPYCAAPLKAALENVIPLEDTARK